MESIWSKTVDIPERGPLSGSVSAEAAVIGGGMAGILTAFYLQRLGMKTIVLEAQRIGGGQTGNTTAKITAQHGLLYRKLEESLGAESAALYAAANQRAVEEYRRLVDERDIACGFRDCPAFLYSVEEEEPLRLEAEAMRRAGLKAAFTTDTELPFPISAAVRLNEQAQFHPLRFLKAVAEDLTIYEHTRVRSVYGGRITTDGGTVTAKQIIFAAHYPFLNAPGYYFMRMHQERSYVLALENAFVPEGMYLGIEKENGWSLRGEGKNLLFGGCGHRTGENRSGGRYETLRRKALSLWPDSRETAGWSAQDCMTLDGVPYIGRFSAAEPDWYVVTGFGKWGMTSSMVSALLLTDLIAGRASPWTPLFSPQRFTPSASCGVFLENGIHAVRDLSRQMFSPPRADLDALPVGHGGVVDCNGEKTGVYKDEKGGVWMVSTRCPHLGCQLEWNPDEKSWDCPCHGSRFDYTGKLIDNPAQEPLRSARSAPNEKGGTE